MPTSAYQNTVYVVDLLHKLEPQSMLDVGSGFGKWGFLSRLHLTMGHSLTVEPDQDLKIDAVEVFKRNVSPVYDAVYNNTYIGDAREVVPTLGKYDVIVCGDMIEHMGKEDAWPLIQEMRDRASMALVLALPLGECPSEPIYGNDYEAHRSTWHASDFKGEDCYVRSFDYHLTNVRIGVVIFPVSDHARWLVRNLRNPIRRYLSILRRKIRSV